MMKCSFRLNQPGDVLIAMYGATIGKLAILAEPAVTNQAVCGCTPFVGVLNTYLFAYLMSRRSDFHSRSEGGAQPNISKVKIVSSPFALPPFAEQKRIVERVGELMTLCDRLEAAYTKRELKKRLLLEALLHQAIGPAR
jgi:type I restriction enzyme S subunit